MLNTFFNYNWDYWLIAGKVTFDGPNRLIIVNEGVTELDISRDVYSSWKNWLLEGFGSTFLPAIRSVGGDPIDVETGQYAGDLYFLINNWKLIIDLEKVRVTGVLYSDNFNTAYYNAPNSPVYPASVSNIVSKQVNKEQSLTAQNIADLVAAVWKASMAEYIANGTTGSALNNASTASTLPNVNEIATAVDTELAEKLTTINDGIKDASILVPHTKDI